jgi:hypothetical protein
MKKQYAVYVSEDGGWLDACPERFSVFFGGVGKFVHANFGGIGPVGHVVVIGHRAAIALRDTLNTSGDWECDDGRRPEYAVRGL